MRKSHNTVHGLAFTLFAAGVPWWAQAQDWPCPSPEWRGASGLQGIQTAMTNPNTTPRLGAIISWDPDGPGPKGSILALGGTFEYAGTEVVNHVAGFDPESGVWTAFGAGVTGSTQTGQPVVDALLALPNGDLLAGGNFINAGGQPAGRFARWTGSAWVPSPVGTNDRCTALALRPNGDVVAGGIFTIVAGLPANRIAISTAGGTGSWSAMGSGMNEAVQALASLDDGTLIAGGWFSTAGGVFANYIARWDGTTWSPVGQVDGGVLALEPIPGGGFAAAGQFSVINGQPMGGVAACDGTQWTALGTGLQNGSQQAWGYALARTPGGELIVGGAFTHAGGVATKNLARWTGAKWTPMGPGLNQVYALLARSNGEVYAGEYAGNVHRWTGAGWKLPGKSDTVGTALSVAEDGDQSALVGAWVIKGDGQVIAPPARWDGTEWSDVGGGVGLSGGSSTVRAIEAIAPREGGGFYAAGTFDKAGAMPANNVARWDGSAWSALAQGLTNTTPGTSVVYDLQTLPSGELLAGGNFDVAGTVQSPYLARWDGTSWSTFGTFSGWAPVWTLGVFPSGDPVAGGGTGGMAQGYVFKWNGAQWEALGGMQPNATVYALIVLDNGDLIIGGDFNYSNPWALPASKIARWDGVKWSSLGSGTLASVTALCPAPGGSFFVGANSVINGTSGSRLAYWNGTSFTWPDAGIGYYAVGALRYRAAGELLIAGGFTQAGTKASPGFAVYGCPPQPACAPDCDQNGTLDINDFVCFQTLYALGDPKADCDASGVLDIDDFICFQTVFAIGC